MLSASKRMLAVTIGLMLLCTGVLWAQEEENEDGMPQLVRETVEQLKQQGWTEEELERFRTAARSRNWEDAEGADPEVVAMALQLANQDREQLEGAENADLALELATVARNMERSGYEKQEIARTAFDGTRDVVQNMERIRERARNGEDGNGIDKTQLRERVRSQIRDRLAHAKEQSSRAMNRREKAEGRGPARGKPEGTPGDGAGDSGNGAPGSQFRP